MDRNEPSVDKGVLKTLLTILISSLCTKLNEAPPGDLNWYFEEKREQN